MELEQIVELIDRVSASELDSFCLEQNGMRLSLKKKQPRKQTDPETQSTLVQLQKQSESPQEQSKQMSSVELTGTERAGSIPGHYRSALPPGRGGEDQYSHVDIVRAGGLLWRHHGLFAGTQRPAGVTRDGPPNGGQEGLAPAKGLVQPGCTPHFLFRLAEKKTGRARSKRKGRLGALRCSGPPRATGVGVSVQAPI